MGKIFTWWIKDQKFNLMTSTPNTMEEKVSVILLTMQSAPASILHKALNITKLFYSVGTMDPLNVKYNPMINQKKK